EAVEAFDHALRLRLGQLQTVDDHELSRRVPGRHRGTECRPARRSRQAIGIAARLRSEDRASTRPNRRTAAAGARASRALLPPGLLPTAAHQTTGLRRGGTGPP